MVPDVSLLWLSSWGFGALYYLLWDPGTAVGCKIQISGKTCFCSSGLGLGA